MKEITERTRLSRAQVEGVQHRYQMRPRRPVPGMPLNLTVTTPSTMPIDRVRCWYTTSSNDEPRYRTVDFVQEGSCWSTLEWGYVLEWHGQLPSQPDQTRLQYHIGAHIAGTDGWVFADNQARALEEGTPFVVWIDDTGTPDWANEALIYHIFIDRFNPGNGKPWKSPSSLSGFFGGTLQGIIEKLDYIQSMGFNTLWLSPLFESPTHHGYDATDYYQVEPRFGTRADLQGLIDAAHHRGMRILFDFVANHWSNRHPRFVEAQRKRDSPYYDWYLWQKWPKDYESFFGVKQMPKLNLKHPPARQYLLDCAQYWLEQGVDGYRLDHANGPPADFWADFRRVCRTANPDCWLLGEIVQPANKQLAYAPHLDGTLDFLLADALRSTFATQRWSLTQFEGFLQGHENHFPDNFCRPAFLDNHDMTRILYLADDDQARARLGALALFTLGGPPIVYYGTEVGISQLRPLGRFEEARLPMPWDLDLGTELTLYFQNLAKLRKAHVSLRQGTRKLVHLDDTTGCYAYLRHTQEDQVLVVFNRGQESQTLTLRCPGIHPDARDGLNGQRVQIQEERVSISLGAQQGAIIA